MPNYRVTYKGIAYRVNAANPEAARQLAEWTYNKETTSKQTPNEGFFADIGNSFGNTASGIQTGLESTFGDENKAAVRAAERDARRASGYRSNVGWDKVEEAGKEGWLSAAVEIGRQSPHVVAEQSGNIALGLAGGAAGAAAAAPFAAPFAASGVGLPIAGAIELVGAGLGAFAPLWFQHKGELVSRQAQTQFEKDPYANVNINTSRANWGATANALLDTGGMALGLGKKVVSNIVRSPAVQRALREEGLDAAKKVAQEGFLKAAGKGAARMVAAEVPTETAQSFVERANAGLETNPFANTPGGEEAKKEYLETAYQTALMAPLGGLGGLYDRSVARGQVEQADKNLNKYVKDAGTTEVLPPNPFAPKPEPAKPVSPKGGSPASGATVDPNAPAGGKPGKNRPSFDDAQIEVAKDILLTAPEEEQTYGQFATMLMQNMNITMSEAKALLNTLARKKQVSHESGHAGGLRKRTITPRVDPSILTGDMSKLTPEEVAAAEAQAKADAEARAAAAAANANAAPSAPAAIDPNANATAAVDPNATAAVDPNATAGNTGPKDFSFNDASIDNASTADLLAANAGAPTAPTIDEGKNIPFDAGNGSNVLKAGKGGDDLDFGLFSRGPLDESEGAPTELVDEEYNRNALRNQPAEEQRTGGIDSDVLRELTEATKPRGATETGLSEAEFADKQSQFSAAEKAKRAKDELVAKLNKVVDTLSTYSPFSRIKLEKVREALKNGDLETAKNILTAPGMKAVVDEALTNRKNKKPVSYGGTATSISREELTKQNEGKNKVSWKKTILDHLKFNSSTTTTPAGTEVQTLRYNTNRSNLLKDMGLSPEAAESPEYAPYRDALEELAQEGHIQGDVNNRFSLSTEANRSLNAELHRRHYAPRKQTAEKNAAKEDDTGTDNEGAGTSSDLSVQGTPAQGWSSQATESNGLDNAGRRTGNANEGTAPRSNPLSKLLAANWDLLKNRKAKGVLKELTKRLRDVSGRTIASSKQEEFDAETRSIAEDIDKLDVENNEQVKAVASRLEKLERANKASADEEVKDLLDRMNKLKGFVEEGEELDKLLDQMDKLIDRGTPSSGNKNHGDVRRSVENYVEGVEKEAKELQEADEYFDEKLAPELRDRKRKNAKQQREEREKAAESNLAAQERAAQRRAQAENERQRKEDSQEEGATSPELIKLLEAGNLKAILKYLSIKAQGYSTKSTEDVVRDAIFERALKVLSTFSGKFITPKALAEELGVDINSARVAFRDLSDAGAIETIANETRKQNNLPYGSRRVNKDAAANYVSSGGKSRTKTSPFGEVFRQLASALANSLADFSNVRIVVEPSTGQEEVSYPHRAAFTLMKKEGARGAYDPKTNTIYLRRNGLDEATILHETLHAATVSILKRFYTSPESLSANEVEAAIHIIKIWKHAGRYFSATQKQKYAGALENVYEFVSYGLTDKNFGKALSEIQTPSLAKYTKVVSDLYDQFSQALAEMYGLITRGVRRVLNQSYSYAPKSQQEILDRPLDRTEVTNRKAVDAAKKEIAEARKRGVKPDSDEMLKLLDKYVAAVAKVDNSANYLHNKSLAPQRGFEGNALIELSMAVQEIISTPSATIDEDLKYAKEDTENLTTDEVVDRAADNYYDSNYGYQYREGQYGPEQIRIAQEIRNLVEGFLKGGRKNFNQAVDKVFTKLTELNRKLADRSIQQRNNQKVDLVRNPYNVRERLLRAVREGFLSPEGLRIAEYMLDKNPAIATQLAISVRQQKKDTKNTKFSENDVLGLYTPIEKLVTLLKRKPEQQRTATVAHEFLHHTERMLPEHMRWAIRNEWLKNIKMLIEAAHASGNDTMFEALNKAVLATYGDEQAAAEFVEKIKDKTYPREWYQWFNPSEYWAENGSEMLQRRVAPGFVNAIRRFLRNLLEHIKDALGMPNNTAVIRAIDAVLNPKEVTGKITGYMLATEVSVYNAPSSGGRRKQRRTKVPSKRATRDERIAKGEATINKRLNSGRVAFLKYLKGLSKMGAYEFLVTKIQDSKRPLKVLERTLRWSGLLKYGPEGNNLFGRLNRASGIARDEYTRRLHLPFKDLQDGIKEFSKEQKVNLVKAMAILDMVMKGKHILERRHFKFLREVPLSIVKNIKLTGTSGNSVVVSAAEYRQKIFELCETNKVIDTAMGDQYRQILEHLAANYADVNGSSLADVINTGQAMKPQGRSIDENDPVYDVYTTHMDDVRQDAAEYDQLLLTSEPFRKVVDAAEEIKKQQAEMDRAANYRSQPAENFVNLYGFKHWVSLKGKPDKSSPTDPNVEDHYEINGKSMGGDYRADLAATYGGRESESDNVLMLLKNDAAKSALRFGRIGVMDALKTLIGARNKTDPQYIGGRMIGTIDFADRYRGTVDKKFQGEGLFYNYMPDGKIEVYKVDEKKYSEAIRKTTEYNGAMAMMAAVTSWIGQWHTRYNISFPLKNFYRDALFNAGILSANYGPKKALVMVGRMAEVLAQGGTFYKSANFSRLYANGKMAELEALAAKERADGSYPFYTNLLEYSRKGGRTSHVAAIAMQGKFDDMLRDLESGKISETATRSAAFINKYVDVAGDMFELNNRIAAYSVLKEIHTEKMLEKFEKDNNRIPNAAERDIIMDNAIEEAANETKELTNFEASGDWGRTLGAFYTFVRPAATGGVAFLDAAMPGLPFMKAEDFSKLAPKALQENATAMDEFEKTFKEKQKFARQTMLISTAFGASIVLMAAAMADDDDKGRNEVDTDDTSQWVRGMRLPTSWFGGKSEHRNDFVTLPWGFGFGGFAAAGAQLALTARGDQGLFKMIGNIRDAMFDSIMPIPISRIPITEDKRGAGWGFMSYAIDTLAPSPIRPFVEAAMNMDGLGRTLFNDRASKYNPSYLGGDEIPPLYRSFARKISDATDGKLTPDPKTLQFLVSNLMDGFGQIAVMTHNLYLDATGEKYVNLKEDLPMIGGFIGKSASVDARQFANVTNQIESLRRQMNANLDNEEGMYRFRAAHPNAENAIEMFDMQMAGLNEIRAELKYRQSQKIKSDDEAYDPRKISYKDRTQHLNMLKQQRNDYMYSLINVMRQYGIEPED